MPVQNPTANYGWILPTVGASLGAWGGLLNTLLGDDASGLDAIIKGVSDVASAALPKAGGTVIGGLEVNGALTKGGTAVSLAGHTHAWSAITSGIPAFASRWPDWTEVTGKPATFTPSAHTHAWGDITSGVPTFASRWPTYAEVTDKPATFAPSAHGHAWGDISGAPVYTTRWADWAEVTGKPSTFTPSAHSHAWADITSGIPAFASRWPDWTEVTGKPSTFAPSAHSHSSVDPGSTMNGETLLAYRVSTSAPGSLLPANTIQLIYV